MIINQQKVILFHLAEMGPVRGHQECLAIITQRIAEMIRDTLMQPFAGNNAKQSRHLAAGYLLG